MGRGFNWKLLAMLGMPRAALDPSSPPPNWVCPEGFFLLKSAPNCCCLLGGRKKAHNPVSGDFGIGEWEEGWERWGLPGLPHRRSCPGRGTEAAGDKEQRG